MADDIKKKITIDVQVNTGNLDQVNKYASGLQNISDAATGATKSTGEAAGALKKMNDSMSKPPDENIFKRIFSNVISYYKQGQSDANKSAITDAQKKNTQIATNTKISQDQTNTAIVAADKKTNDQVVANAKASQDKIRASEIDSVQKTTASAFTIITQGIDQRTDATVRGLEATRKAIDSNASLSAATKKQQENTLYAEEYKVKLKAFKNEQKANIAQAIMNGAIAVTKAEADLGPIAGTLALGAIVAQTAAQVATIKRQQPPTLQTAEKGGYFKSDGKGAVLPGYSKTDNVNAFIRSGEAVVVSEAMRDPWARNLVSAINVAYGGRDFSVPNISRGYAVGGIFTDGGNANRYYNQPMNDQKNLANTIAYQMINNFPPVYVDVKDINNQQNILAQTVNRVNL